MRNVTILAAAFAAQFATLNSAYAQDRDQPDGFSLGVVAGAVTDPYIGDNEESLALPLITYRNGPFEIGTLGLSYDFYETDTLDFSAGLAPRFTGLDDPDAIELQGIDRDVTIDLVLRASYDLGSGVSLQGRLLQEVTGEHDGQQFDIELGYSTALGQTGVNLVAGAKWQSSDLSNYAWGVAPSEALLGRPAYEAGSVVIPYLSIELARPINEDWTIFGALEAEFLPSEVENSPIVDESTLFGITLGVVYQF